MKLPLSTPAALLALNIGLATAAASKGCGTKTTLKRGGVGNSNSQTITLADGSKRTYLLHIPTKYNINTPAPLILSFHGRGKDGANQETRTQLSNEDLNSDSLVVYPDGIDNVWQGDPDADGYDDISFVLQLLNKLEKQLCIDTSRIYSSGMSNGGGFSVGILACDSTANKRFAAFSSCSGPFYQGDSEDDCDPTSVAIDCDPARDGIPVLSFHGAEDDTIPYYGGPRRDRCLPSVPRWFRNWAKVEHISTPLQSSYDDGLNSTVHVVSKDASYYKVGGLAHMWPSIKNGAKFDATPKIIKFFKQYTLPAGVKRDVATTFEA